HPAEFYAALLNNQPMGFYHPATVVRDAIRRGQAVRPVDVGRSAWRARVEDGAVRLGLGQVKGLREAAAIRLVDARRTRPFASVDDLCARAGLSREEVTALAEVGALGSLGLWRRAALWQAERAARPPGPLFAGHAPGPEPSPLREMSVTERLVADYRGTRVTGGAPPTAPLRARRARAGGAPPAGPTAPAGAPRAPRAAARWSCASARGLRRASSFSRSRTRPGSPMRSWRPRSSSGRAPRSSTNRSSWWTGSSSTRTASQRCGRRPPSPLPRGRRSPPTT